MEVEYWHLTGDANQFSDQLERRYKELPVFAVLLGGGDTVFPILDQFSKDQQIPCLFPESTITLPESSQPEFTVRFCNGMTAHLRGIAEYINQRPHLKNVLVLNDEVLSAEDLSAKFSVLLSDRKNSQPTSIDQWIAKDQGVQHLASTDCAVVLVDDQRRDVYFAK